ncbi:hypothetical protein J2S08_003361, partial [Bacillus chungangensis]|nr:hypothetical protein [Bacillus chungangensis]
EIFTRKIEKSEFEDPQIHFSHYLEASYVPASFRYIVL